MWSQKILNVASSGTARNAPGTPQIQKKNASPMKIATGLSVSRCPSSIGVTRFAWSRLMARKLPGIEQRAAHVGEASRPASVSTTTAVERAQVGHELEAGDERAPEQHVRHAEQPEHPGDHRPLDHVHEQRVER